MKPDLPISLKMTLAMLSGDRKQVDRVVNESFATLGHELMGVVNSYDFTDLPFVLAAMQITANSLMPLLDDSGRNLVEKMKAMTTVITIDADEMRRQAGGHDDGESEEH